MPLVPGSGIPPSAPTAPHVVPAAQRVVPVEPARRITAAKGTSRSAVDPDDKRRQQHSDHSGDRGSTLDVEV